KFIIPGVIDSLTNVVEHPELVAERIVRYAELVGKENVIAGTDCGFSTGVRAQPRVHPTVAWAKLQALAEGAQLATQQLWGLPARARRNNSVFEVSHWFDQCDLHGFERAGNSVLLA